MICLYVTALDNSTLDWTEVGNTPYLRYIDYDVHYISTDADGNVEGDFDFEDTAQGGYPTIVEIALRIRSTTAGDDRVIVWIFDGSDWANIGTITPTTSWQWLNVDISSVLDTFTKVNAAMLRLEYEEV